MVWITMKYTLFVRITNQTHEICCMQLDDRMLHIYKSVVVCEQARVQNMINAHADICLVAPWCYSDKTWTICDLLPMVIE